MGFVHLFHCTYRRNELRLVVICTRIYKSSCIYFLLSLRSRFPDITLDLYYDFYAFDGSMSHYNFSVPLEGWEVFESTMTRHKTLKRDCRSSVRMKHLLDASQSTAVLIVDQTLFLKSFLHKRGDASKTPLSTGIKYRILGTFLFFFREVAA